MQRSLDSTPTWSGLNDFEIDPDDATESIVRAFVHAEASEVTQYQQRERVLRSLGAAWHRVRSADLDSRRDWYVAGEPLQVLLGLTDDDAVVGVVEVEPFGYMGPGRLRADRMSTPVALREQGAIAAVKRRLQAAERRRRSDFGYCKICRRHLPPELGGGGECRECLTMYFGMIID